MNGFAVIAQLNIDVLFSGISSFPNLGEEIFAKNFDIQLGGGPQVSAILLERLGISTKFGTFYTNDVQSRLGLQLLEDCGYKNYHNLYEKSGNPTVVTSVFSFPTDRSFVAYNENADDSLLSDDAVYNFLKGSKIAFAPISINAAKKLKADGTKLVFDTGWHDDLSVEKYKDILELVDVFTPNDKEALKMTSASTLDDALKILAGYVKHPIVKTGKYGCKTIIGNEIVTVDAVDDFLSVDTTGAGDNFLAGVVYGLYNDWPIEKCMQMGNITGGYSTTALGCLNANLTKEHAAKLLSKHY